MKIQDYLHLYFGCPCIFRYGPTGEWKDGFVKEVALQRVRHGASYQVKPILRKLADITREENQEHFSLQTNHGDVGCGCIGNLVVENGASIAYLFSKHFDLFGLIDAGLAIDATTIFEHKQKSVL